MTDRLEALADAIANLNGWHDPSSEAYQLRNPLLLRAYSLSRMQEHDEKGRRRFESAMAGYRAGLYDLNLKCRGQSRSKLEETATLRELLGTYQLGNAIAVKRVRKWLSAALEIEEYEIDGRLPVRWFVADGQHIQPLPGETFSLKEEPV